MQIGSYPTEFPNRDLVFSPAIQPPGSLTSIGDYYDYSLPQVAPPAAPPAPPPLPTLVFPASSLSGDRLTLSYRAPSKATPVLTNLVAAPYLVSVHGAQVAGRVGGAIVLRLPAGSGTRTVTLSRSDRVPLVLGRILSIIGLLGLLAVLGGALVSPWRSRRKAVAAPDH